MKVFPIVPSSFVPLERLPRDLITENPDDADIILVGSRMASQLFDVLPRATNVQWIHALAAGVEPSVRPERLSLEDLARVAVALPA